MLSDLNSKLIELVKEGLTLEELSQTLNLSYEEIYNLFRLISPLGYDFNRIYYADGSIRYVKKDLVKQREMHGCAAIITEPGDGNLEIIATSDFHLGDRNDRIDYIERLYEFCLKNNIHIIANCGDLVSGIRKSQHGSLCDTYLDQFHYLLDNHPSDKSILNFVVLGNHDIEALNREGLDLSTFLYNYRPDIIPLGFGRGKILFKNDQIFLSHSLNADNNCASKILAVQDDILFYGHSHFFSCSTGRRNGISIHVPPLSEVPRENGFPGFIKVNLRFVEGVIDAVFLESLAIVNNKIESIGKFHFYRRIYDVFNETVKYEENMPTKIRRIER